MAFDAIFCLANYLLYDRQPSTEEYEVMEQLQKDISNLDEIVLRKKLKELHGLCEVGAYEDKCSSWKILGFQQRDPLSDIRGGGELSVDNLLYFVKHNRSIALQMMKKRSDRGEGEKNYPWAAASISVTRLVASLFSIIDPVRGSIVNKDKMLNVSYYKLILENDGFNRLYEQAFLLLDYEFDLINGTYMEFPTALENSKQKFLIILNKSASIEEVVHNVKKEMHK